MPLSLAIALLAAVTTHNPMAIAIILTVRQFITRLLGKKWLTTNRPGTTRSRAAHNCSLRILTGECRAGAAVRREIQNTRRLLSGSSVCPIRIGSKEPSFAPSSVLTAKYTRYLIYTRCFRMQTFPTFAPRLPLPPSKTLNPAAGKEFRGKFSGCGMWMGKLPWGVLGTDCAIFATRPAESSSATTPEPAKPFEKFASRLDETACPATRRHDTNPLPVRFRGILSASVASIILPRPVTLGHNRGSINSKSWTAGMSNYP